VDVDVDVDVDVVVPPVFGPPPPMLLAPTDVEPIPEVVLPPVLALSELAVVTLVVVPGLSVAAGSESEAHAGSKAYAIRLAKPATQRVEAPQYQLDDRMPAHDSRFRLPARAALGNSGQLDFSGEFCAACNKAGPRRLRLRGARVCPLLELYLGAPTGAA